MVAIPIPGHEEVLTVGLGRELLPSEQEIESEPEFPRLVGGEWGFQTPPPTARYLA